MAKGLFSVYCDPAPASVNKSSNSVNSAPSRSTSRTSALSSYKENINPFNTTRQHGLLGCQGKQVLKSVGAASSMNKQSSSSTASLGVKQPRQSKVDLTVSTNGICTGVLRTRVLPSGRDESLDNGLGAAVNPVSDTSRSTRLGPAARSHSKPTNSASSAMSRPRHPGHRHFSELSATTTRLHSPASAHDSGYAHSDSSEHLVEEVRPETDEWDLDMSVDEDSRADNLRTSVQGESSNRRARALTESPLAEVSSSITCRREAFHSAFASGRGPRNDNVAEPIVLFEADPSSD